jgi:hypothetical protein
MEASWAGYYWRTLKCAIKALAPAPKPLPKTSAESTAPLAKTKRTQGKVQAETVKNLKNTQGKLCKYAATEKAYKT